MTCKYKFMASGKYILMHINKNGTTKTDLRSNLKCRPKFHFVILCEFLLFKVSESYRISSGTDL